jgi:hypothetical protein
MSYKPCQSVSIFLDIEANQALSQNYWNGLARASRSEGASAWLLGTGDGPDANRTSDSNDMRAIERLAVGRRRSAVRRDPFAGPSNRMTVQREAGPLTRSRHARSTRPRSVP